MSPPSSSVQTTILPSVVTLPRVPATSACIRTAALKGRGPAATAPLVTRTAPAGATGPMRAATSRPPSSRRGQRPAIDRARIPSIPATPHSTLLY